LLSCKKAARREKQAQKLFVGAGLKKTAEVVSDDEIEKMALNRYSQASGMGKMVFSNYRDAA